MLRRFLAGGVFEALSEWGAELLVSFCLWPLLVHRMRRMAEAGEPFTARLARLHPTPPPGVPARSLARAWVCCSLS
ncbi:hypothetical protein ABZ741_41015, partial [Streptomyces globisporus]